MVIFDFFEQNLDTVFTSLKDKEDVINYEKIDQDRFITLYEKGFYLQAASGLETVSDISVYLLEDGDYFPIERYLLGLFKDVYKLDDLEKIIGQRVANIQSMKIPGIGPTLPGAKYSWGKVNVCAYVNRDEVVAKMWFSKQV